MEPYKNLGRTSAASSYEIGDTFIKVQFKGNPKVYVYSHIKPGQQHVDKMKQFAVAGSGLNAYINHYVRKSYASIE